MKPSFEPVFSHAERIALRAGVAVGGVAFVTGLAIDAPTAWRSLHFAAVYFVSISVMAGGFLAIQTLTHAVWPAVLRRVAESMLTCLPIGAMLLVILFAGMRWIFPWTDTAHHDPILEAKAAWLNRTGVMLRTIVFLGIWIGLGEALRRGSFLPASPNRPAPRTIRAVLFTLVVAITFSLFSVDWLMSVEPHWYSTLYPWYVMSSAFAGMLAHLTLAALVLRARERLTQINESHLHDLGHYIFAFSLFWGYLAFSQYMLIWYANLPEEAAHYELRDGFWKAPEVVNALVNLALPFALLSRAAKRNAKVLGTICAALVIGHGLDFLLLTMPAGGPLEAAGVVICAAVALGVGALYLLTLENRLRQRPLVPEEDPRLPESMSHRAG